MAYDLKADWEQTKKNVARVEKELRLSASSQVWNREMTELVNAYKNEEMLFYNEDGIRENAFQTTTQNLWYTHFLNKKRLKALGLEAKYEYIRPTNYDKGKNQRFPQWSYSHDGKNLICKIGDSMNYRKIYFKNRQFVWVDDGKGLPGEYYIIQSKSMNGSYICPSCGHEDTLENLLDGCDYCHTVFQIGDFKQKVSSVYKPDNRTQQRDGFTIYKNLWPLYLILCIVFMAIMANISALGGVAMIFMPVIMMILIAVFLGVLFGKTGKESVEDGPARNANTLEKLRTVDPHFSEETFIGNLSNKVISIHYADLIEDISCFVECDMTSLINAYRGVIDCKLLECVMMEYHADSEYQHLDVKVKVGMTVYENNQSHKVEEKLRIYLVRSLNAVTQSTNDVNVYRCHSCGGSLSLLNGGRCEYCGSGLDLKEYDWVIAGYQQEK